MLGISSEATIKVYTWICLGFRIAPPPLEFFFLGATIKVYAGISSAATIKVYTHNLRKKGGSEPSIPIILEKKGGPDPLTPPPWIRLCCTMYLCLCGRHLEIQDDTTVNFSNTMNIECVRCDTLILLFVIFCRHIFHEHIQDNRADTGIPCFPTCEPNRCPGMYALRL